MSRLDGSPAAAPPVPPADGVVVVPGAAAPPVSGALGEGAVAWVGVAGGVIAGAGGVVTVWPSVVAVVAVVGVVAVAGAVSIVEDASSPPHPAAASSAAAARPAAADLKLRRIASNLVAGLHVSSRVWLAPGIKSVSRG
ncbi:MAG: hypothetical protein R2736_01730 [Solirubrobacterales bacterium]